MKSRPPRWNIAELGVAVERALALDYDGQRNGQVREIPDPRTIRYYASLGLVDPPAEMRGRTALYTRKHLLQVVAVKRLQAAGRSLVEIQQQLLGLTEAALVPIANVPSRLETTTLAPEASKPAPRQSDGAFWLVPPAPVTTPLVVEAVRTLQIIRLSETVSLVVEATEPPDATLTDALRTAAEPLLRLLRTQSPAHPDQENR